MLKIFLIRPFHNNIFLIFNVGGCKYVINFVGSSKAESQNISQLRSRQMEGSHYVDWATSSGEF